MQPPSECRQDGVGLIYSSRSVILEFFKQEPIIVYDISDAYTTTCICAQKETCTEMVTSLRMI